jgi:hypothetical protein
MPSFESRLRGRGAGARHLTWLALALVGMPAVPAFAQTSPPFLLGAANEKTTPHLRATWHASPDTLAPGKPASIVVEVVPAPGMRVYAPGQQDYIAVSLAVVPNPAVKIGETKLPKPVEHVFPPTGETSLVFERPFRMEVPVSLAPASPSAAAGRAPAQATAAAGPIVVEGTFEYQACDDMVCYRPVRIPMSWSLSVSRPAAPAKPKGAGV